MPMGQLKYFAALGISANVHCKSVARADPEVTKNVSEEADSQPGVPKQRGPNACAWTHLRIHAHVMSPPPPPASQRRHAAGWTRGLEEGGPPAPGLPFTGQVNRHQPHPLSSPGCCWLSERNFMPAWAVSSQGKIPRGGRIHPHYLVSVRRDLEVCRLNGRKGATY